jgi:hypothetical protein
MAPIEVAVTDGASRISVGDLGVAFSLDHDETISSEGKPISATSGPP